LPIQVSTVTAATVVTKCCHASAKWGICWSKGGELEMLRRMSLCV